MAKFRQNHAKTPGRGQFMLRGILYTVFFMVLVVVGVVMLGRMTNTSTGKKDTDIFGSGEFGSLDYLPRADETEIIKHNYFALGYNEDYEQADWVAYLLTRASLEIPNVDRTDYFETDPAVSTGSAHYNDYRSSGYTRGHLVPAADMAFDEVAMKETFYMSNVSPQLRAFNGGVWRELEELVRDWTYDNKELYITTGPIFGREPTRIGRNRVAVPEGFYKTILDVSTPEQKAIAFLLPHRMSDQPIMDYAITVDSLESLLDIDFFPGLYVDPSEEHRLESAIDIELWPIDIARFQRRVEIWNNQ